MHAIKHRCALTAHVEFPTRAAFTLVEMVTVLTIIASLFTVGLSQLARSQTPSSLTEATHLVMMVIDNAQTLARASRQPVAILVTEDSCRLTVATIDDTSAPLESSFTLAQNWVTLPDPIMLNLTQTSTSAPNALATTSVDGAYLGHTKALHRHQGSAQLLPSVHYLLVDARGCILAEEHSAPGTLSEYVNKSAAVSLTQRGCYLFLHPRAEPHLEQSQKIYFSPLTGHITPL